MVFAKRFFFAEKRLERLFLESNRHPKDVRIQSQLLEVHLRMIHGFRSF
jgi:hypothetical protein